MAVDLDKKAMPIIRMTVIQDDHGFCKVIEHSMVTGKEKLVASFPPDKRNVKGPQGQDAVMDLAQIRAIVFAQMFEELVNSGKVYLG